MKNSMNKRNDRTMKKITRLLVLAIFPALPIVSSSADKTLSDADARLEGRKIAEKADRIDTSKDGYRQATMVIQRGAHKLVRKLKMWGKKYGDDERTLIRFDEPADVRDTQYLSWVYDATDQDDDMWVYFPSENLVRRISGGGKKGSFMRSDFANEDIEKRAVDDDTHRLIGSVELNGRDCYLLESSPVPVKAKDSNYTRRLRWIDKEYWLPVKIEFYDRHDRLVKIMLQGGIENIDGIWTATKLIMETPRKKSRTLMQYFDVTYDTALDDALFEHSALKR